MRSTGGLWPALCSRGNLEAALRAAAAGKRRTVAAAAFLFYQERHLGRLADELRTRTWRPPRARVLLIREPKPRAIAVAPFECRVVHHALCDPIERFLAVSYTADTFACLTGRGSHRAVLRHRALMGRHRFLLQMDVRKFFPSIDHHLLLNLLARRLREEAVLELCERIIEGERHLYFEPGIRVHLGDPSWRPMPGRGLPVGFLTSQVWGNFYLSGLDHFIKRDLKVPGYLRYMDNLTLFGEQRRDLRSWEGQVGAYLRERLHLDVREDRTRLVPCTATVDYLGYRVSRTGHEVSAATCRRFSRKVARAALAPRRGMERRLPRTLASYRGLVML